MKKSMFVKGIFMVFLMVMSIGKSTSVISVETMIESKASSTSKVEGTWNISEAGTDNVTATLYKDGTLVISGEGNMKSNPLINQTEELLNKIKHIKIQEGVTNIGDNAFLKCYYVTDVEIANSITNIGARAFEYCVRLTNINIPKGVTQISGSAFNDCNTLININVEDENKNYISENGILFNKDKTQLIRYPSERGETTEYTIPSTVEIIGDYAFYNCQSLTSIEIPETVNLIGNYAFYNCYKLKSIQISKEVIKIGDFALANISELEEIILDENNSYYSMENGILFDKNKETLILYPAKKKDLTEYIIPNSVNKIDNYAFSCSNLKQISIPSNVKKIGDSAFAHCKQLKNIEIPSSVTNIGIRLFAYCTELESVKIPSSITNIKSSMFENCHSLVKIEIPTTATQISEGAFYYCKKLKQINIPLGVNNIGDRAFGECQSLEKVSVYEGSYAQKHMKENYNYELEVVYSEDKGTAENIENDLNIDNNKNTQKEKNLLTEEKLPQAGLKYDSIINIFIGITFFLILLVINVKKYRNIK